LQRLYTYMPLYIIYTYMYMYKKKIPLLATGIYYYNIILD